MASCSNSPAGVYLPTVGPEPPSSPDSQKGVLIVYSELERVTPPFDEFELRRSAFDVISETRNDVQHIANNQESDEPVRLYLAPGRYVVAASTRKFGVVKVPVIIATDNSTLVHLDGSKLANAEQHSGEQIVRLPNGAAVGWAASSNASALILETIGKSR